MTAIEFIMIPENRKEILAALRKEHKSDAEDIIQDLILSLVKNGHDKDLDNPRAYWHRMACNGSIDVGRSLAKESKVIAREIHGPVIDQHSIEASINPENGLINILATKAATSKVALEHPAEFKAAMDKYYRGITFREAGYKHRTDYTRKAAKGLSYLQKELGVWYNSENEVRQHAQSRRRDSRRRRTKPPTERGDGG